MKYKPMRVDYKCGYSVPRSSNKKRSHKQCGRDQDSSPAYSERARQGAGRNGFRLVARLRTANRVRRVSIVADPAVHVATSVFKDQ